MTDTISILSELRSNYCCFYAVDEPYYHALSEAIRALSAERKGKWVNNIHDIPICNQCGYMTPFDRAIDDYEYGNYCPSCGARMESE